MSFSWLRFAYNSKKSRADEGNVLRTLFSQVTQNCGCHSLFDAVNETQERSHIGCKPTLVDNFRRLSSFYETSEKTLELFTRTYTLCE